MAVGGLDLTSLASTLAIRTAFHECFHLAKGFPTLEEMQALHAGIVAESEIARGRPIAAMHLGH